MKPSRATPGFSGAMVAGLLLFLWATPGISQEFAWRLSGPGTIHDNETFVIEVSLASSGIPEGSPGVDGWQLGVAHENLTLVDLTFEGTDIEDSVQHGFFSLEPTVGAGNAGFISGVVLSLGEEVITLPPTGEQVVARATYLVKRSACFLGAGVRIEDGLSLLEEPIDNRISQDGASYRPEFDRIDYPECLGNNYTLGLSPSLSPLRVRPRESLPFEVIIRLEQEVSSARAWNLALQHDEVLDLIDSGIEGLELQEHLAEDGFVQAELTRGPANEGMIVRAELSPSLPVSLRPRELDVLRIRFELPAATELSRDLSEVTVNFAGQLRGSGGVIENEVFPAGFLSLQRELRIPLDWSLLGPYRRGDANGDSKIDISDSLNILGFLFLGHEVPCQAAAEVNGSGKVDISDAIGLLQYLFTTGTPPAPPFPDCHRDSGEVICDRPACPGN